MGKGGDSLPLIILFIVGCIFFLPSKVIDLREQEMLFPLVGIIMYLAWSIYHRVNRAVGITIAFIVVYALFTFTPTGYRFILMVSVFSFLYYAVATHYEEVERYKTLIMDILCIIALLNVTWIILQVNGIFIFFKPINDIPTIETGFFANRNEVSIFLAACLPFFFRRWWHLGIIPILTGIVLAKTLNGLIGAIIIMAVYGIILNVRLGLSRKTLTVCIAGFLIISAGAYTKYVHGGGIEARASAFKKAAELIYEKPLFGWGVNQGQYVIPLYLNGDRQDVRYVKWAYDKVIYHEDFKRLYLANPERHKTDNRMWIRLHNDYEQWAIETGIVGLLCLLLIIVSHLYAYIKTKGRDMIAGLAILCLLWTANAFFTFQIGRFAFLTVFFLACIQGAYLLQKRRNES
jgi:O-antigen ligase